MKHLMMLGVLLLTTLGVANADGLNLTDKVAVNGIFQGRYGVTQGPSDAWKSGSMDVRRAELGVLVKPIDKLSVKLQADFSTGTTVTKDMWAKYMVRPDLGLTFGQFVVPFGLENQISDADLLTLERATFASTMFPGRRDRGLKVEATDKKATFILAALNGDGPNTKAAGSDKEGVVRLLLPMCPFAKLGVSGLYGHDKGGTRNAFGADVQADFLLFKLSGEWARGHDLGHNPTGWLVQAALPMGSKDQLVGKYDVFSPDFSKDKVGDTQTYNLGLVHTVNKNMNLKLFYVNSQSDKKGHSNGVTAEWMVRF